MAARGCRSGVKAVPQSGWLNTVRVRWLAPFHLAAATQPMAPCAPTAPSWMAHVTGTYGNTGTVSMMPHGRVSLSLA